MSSSSSSSSSSEDGNGNGNGGVGGRYGARRGGDFEGPSSSRRRGGDFEGPSSSRRRGGDFEGPSSSRQRAINEVWPEPFVEALAAQVAIEASRSVGRLAAAAVLANVFQVCSTWRAVSRSDLLWHRLTRRIWGRTNLLHATWRDEYIYRHRTAQNFRTSRYTHFNLHFDPSDVDNPDDGLTCRCLTLSDLYLACGFADGAVRLFDLTTRLHVRTFRPHHRNRLGQFSRAVSGIIITDSQLIFATLDGDIHVAVINNAANQTRRAHPGDVVHDGVLIDFTGCSRYWVGLYAGLAGRAFRIWEWDGQRAVLTFVGGALTDHNTLMGWRMLTEFTEFVGRVRLTSHESVVACTSSRVIIFDLRNQGVVLGEREYRRGIYVTSVDVNNEAYIVVENRELGNQNRGLAIVRRVDTFEEVCRFNFSLRAQRNVNVMGCLNQGYALMCVGGVIMVWEVEQRGDYLYSFRGRIGEEVIAFVGDDRHVAASCETGIHLWDFGA